MSGNIQDIAFAIILIFPILSTMVVGLRFWTRLVTRQIFWDTKSTYQGYHITDVPPLSTKEKVVGQKYNFANQLLYNPILSIVKASVIVFLFRLKDRRAIVRWNLNVLFVVNLGLLVSIFLADFFQCSPFRYVFDYPAMDLAAQKDAATNASGRNNDHKVKAGHCIDQVAFFLGSAGCTIVTDIWLLCIPCLIVWPLQMPKKRKIAVLAVLCMGVIVTALSIARLALYAKRFSPHNKDPTYNIGHTVSGAEVNLAIITASAAALNSGASRIMPRFWGLSAQKSISQQTPASWERRQQSDTDSQPSTKGMYAMTSVSPGHNAPSTSQEEIIRVHEWP